MKSSHGKSANKSITSASVDQARNNLGISSERVEQASERVEQESASADRTQGRGSARLSKRAAEQNKNENFDQARTA